MTLRLLGMFCVVAASLIEAVGQMAFKFAADGGGGIGAAAGLASLRRTPGWVALGVACFVTEGVFFTVSLRLLDVSIAFPAGSLTFVGIVVLSRLWLREAVGPRRWTGVALIVLGACLLGMS
jgi:undecaprenyl phosphate-alpha-L-ara4N flippase subunit ArnE